MALWLSGLSRSPEGPLRLAGKMAEDLSQTLRLGGGEHRRDPHLLPATPGPPQASKDHQHAGETKRGDQASDPGGEDLPEPRQLSPINPGTRRRDP